MALAIVFLTRLGGSRSTCLQSEAWNLSNKVKILLPQLILSKYGNILMMHGWVRLFPDNHPPWVAETKKAGLISDPDLCLSRWSTSGQVLNLLSCARLAKTGNTPLINEHKIRSKLKYKTLDTTNLIWFTHVSLELDQDGMSNYFIAPSFWRNVDKKED